MKIGIFGGTFDPPHMGHLILAEFVRDEMNLDYVWLAPALDPPHKLDRQKTPAHIRYRMVQLACGDDPHIRPSDIDLTHNRRPSYTIDLLDDVSSQNPEHHFSLIIGSDSVLEFTTWKDWRQILERYEVIALYRPDFDPKDANPFVLEHIKFVRNPLIELSSSEIRRRIREGRSVRFMVPAPVLDFIKENNLYRGGNPF